MSRPTSSYVSSGGASVNSRPSSIRSRPKSRMMAKEGEVQSLKFAGMEDNLPTWEESYSPAHLKVFNGKLRLEQGDKQKNASKVVAWELPLKAVKLISGPNDQGIFFITVKHDSVKLVRMGEEAADEKIMREVREQDLIGSSKADLMFVFKAEKRVADGWVEFLEEFVNAAKESKDVGNDRFAGLNSYKSFNQGSRKRRKKKKPKRLLRQQSELIYTLPPSKKVIADPLDPLYAGLRTVAVLCSLVSVCVIGPLILTYLIIVNASRKKKREYAVWLQEVFTHAILWIFPSYALHSTGAAPTSHVSSVEYDESGYAKRDVDKGSTKAKILILNRCSRADFLSVALLANHVDHTGHLRVIVKGRKQMFRYIPFVGPILTWFRFMFLSGKKYNDEPVVHSYIKKLSQENAEWLVFFPEPGPTPITTAGIQRSQEKATNLQRPFLEKVALPSSSLLETCLVNLGLSLEDHEDAEIYDMTVAYSGYVGEFGSDQHPWKRKTDKAVPNIYSLLFNRSSRDFHIHSECFSLREIKETLEGPDGIEAWLDERFAKKDKLLKYFAEKQTFFDPDTMSASATQAQVVENYGSITRMLYLWLATAVIFTVLVVLLVVVLVLRSKVG